MTGEPPSENGEFHAMVAEEDVVAVTWTFSGASGVSRERERSGNERIMDEEIFSFACRKEQVTCECNVTEMCYIKSFVIVI